MPSLREVQYAIRRSLLQHDDGAAAAYVLGDGLTPRQRLGVYHNTFVATLTNALRLSYPAVHRLVGAEFFDGCAEVFVHKHPPRGAYLDEYGGEFPEFLEQFPPATSLAYLAGVARLEWAVNCALHAPDIEPLDITRLAKISPADEDRIRFVPHPSVGFVRADHAVDAIWRAVLAQDDSALGAIDLAAGPVCLMAQRLLTGVEVTRLDESAWRFAVDLCAGQLLGNALYVAVGVDAPALLAEHVTAGRFIEFSLTDTAIAPTCASMQ